MPRISGRTYHFLLATMFLAALLLGGCSKQAPYPGGASKPRTGPSKPYTVWGKTYYPLPHAMGFEQEGLASWYGPNFHGKRTSNGEVYDMDQMTAAHKLLPFGTMVRVTNLDNGRSEVVRINDRGPFVEGRIIDLSREAADRLGVVGPGTARVKLAALASGPAPAEGRTAPPPKPLVMGPFAVQIGSFTVESNAWRLAATVRADLGEEVFVVTYDRGDRKYHRVWVGKVDSMAEAEKKQSRLIAAGLAQKSFVVAW